MIEIPIPRSSGEVTAVEVQSSTDFFPEVVFVLAIFCIGTEEAAWNLWMLDILMLVVAFVRRFFLGEVFDWTMPKLISLVVIDALLYCTEHDRELCIVSIVSHVLVVLVRMVMRFRGRRRGSSAELFLYNENVV